MSDTPYLRKILDDAQRNYQAALRILASCRCPTIEWKIVKVVAQIVDLSKDEMRAATLRGRANQIVRSFAAAIQEEKLTKCLLESKAVREL